MSGNAVFTILSKNYMGQASALRESFCQLHPGVDFYTILIDRRDPGIEQEFPDHRIIWAEELGIKDYWRHSMKFDVIEWSTNVKPFAALHFLKAYSKVLYLDPDLLFYRNVDWVFSELDSCSAVVTPHATTPVYDGHSQGDLEWMRVGTFNLGFIGLSANEETHRFLAWWGARCLSDGFLETTAGVFVDQKWVTLAVGFFPGIRVLYHRGLNMAVWNLHERRLQAGLPEPVLDTGEPVYFFHFSGFDYRQPVNISKRQTRWVAGSRPDIEPLLLDYQSRLTRHRFAELANLPYLGDFFMDGVTVTPLLRRVYAGFMDRFNDEDPYREGSDVYKFALQKGLARKAALSVKRYTAADLSGFSRVTKAFDVFLKLGFRVLGPVRYFNLMRYLGYISSVRNQKDVF